MANSLVRLPLPYVGDFNKGRPLFNAKLFIGEPDLDPEIPANQKTVTGRQEDGTLVTMSQPVRTSSGGYPVYNNAPIELLVDGAYSLKVLDKNDNQTYYFANVEDGRPVTFDDDPVLFDDKPVLYRDTVAEAKADVDLTTGMYVTTKGYNSPNDGGGANYIVVAGGTGTDDGLEFHDMSNGLQLQLIKNGSVNLLQGAGTTQANINTAVTYANANSQILDLTAVSSDVVIPVPSVIATLQEAVDFAFKCIVSSDQVIEIKMDAAFSPTSGVLVENGDYSNIKISSTDATVLLDLSFSGDFIKGVRASMPILDCLIDALGYCDNGYYLEDGSFGKVTSGSGVKKAGMYGLYANSSSQAVANGGVFTECSQSAPAYSGILSWASKVDAFGADVSGSLYYGAQSAASGTLYFRDGIANNCARHNIRATNGAITIARGASALNGGVSGIRSFDLGIVHATDANVSGSSTGIWCENGSTVNAENVTGDNCLGSFIYCNDMSRVNANNATATLSGGYTLRVDNSSEVVSIGSTLSSVDNSVVAANNNSEVNITGAVTSHGGADAMFDVQVSSKLIANNVTSTAALARLATVFDGSEFQFKDGVATFNSPDGINCSGGSLCNVIGSNVLSSDVTGMLFNTLYQRGICWG